MDHMGFQLPAMPPQVMNQPPQIFGAYDGLPQLPPDLAAQMFTDSGLLLDDSNEAKRRRIARVRSLVPAFRRNRSCGRGIIIGPGADGYRPAICVERRRSSVMERCLLVRTA